MADKPKSGSPPAPSFYSAAAGMKPGGSGDQQAGGGANTPAGQSGEKVKNVEVLLEVFQKMDKLEQDADKKAMIQSMVDTAEKYLDALKGMDKGAGTAAPPATGEAGSGGMSTGDAGGGPPMAGAGGGAPGGMAA